MVVVGVSRFLFCEWRSICLFVMCVLFGSGCTQPVPDTSQILKPNPTPGVNVFFDSSKHEDLLRPPYSLAILPFEDYSHHPELGWLKHGLPDMLITDLSGVPKLHLISRFRLGEVLREQLLQHRGTFEETPSVQIGKLTGARYLLGGSYYLVHPHIVIEVHLLDVEKGSVVRALRATGSKEAIPTLEFELSQRIATWFDPEYRTSEQPLAKDVPVAINTPAEMDVSSAPEDNFMMGENNHRVTPSENTTPFVKMDSLLGLERSQLLVDHIHAVVNLIWERGLSIQLGRPEYPLVFNKFAASGNSHGVLLPTSFSTKPEEFREISSDLRVVVRNEPGRDAVLMVNFDHEDPEAESLFVQTLLKPRRVFVRALDQDGQVLGVYSRWEWKTERFIQVQSDGSIQFPSSSSPFMGSKAEFSRKLVSGLRTIDRFDVVIVPVQAERRLVVVEIVEKSNRESTITSEGEGGKSKEAQSPLNATTPSTEEKDEILREALHMWIQEHWAPPIIESIPISGYLPRNRRRAVVLVTEMNGKITANHLEEFSGDDGFSNSIREVFTSITMHCFQPCLKAISQKGNVSESREFRIQFELFKDVRAVGFNQ